jgi:ATP-dependent RNA helicase SUPV3L1/SUV3
MAYDGPFKTTKLNEIIAIAKLIDNLNLAIEQKFNLSTAPLSIRSDYIVEQFLLYAKNIEQNKTIEYKSTFKWHNFASDQEELLHAEDRVKLISLYLWLSYRFEESFINQLSAKDEKMLLNKFIENSLKQSKFKTYHHNKRIKRRRF